MAADIIISCISRSWGGLEIMALEHIKQLKKQGLAAALLCYRNSELHKNAKKSGTIDIINILDSGKISNIRLIQRQLPNVKIIHTHHSHDLWMLVPAIRFCKSSAKLFLTRHVASGISKKDLFHRYIYRRVNRIFAISEFIKNNILKTFPVNESKITILPNGIDLEKFNKRDFNRNEIRSEFNIGNEKLLISLIGRITPGKGHYEFIEAARLINKKFADKVVYMIVGSAAHAEESVEKEIIDLAKDLPNIIFTGFRSDVQKILAATNILAFPSHDESFGVTLLESMAMEVPVVAAISGGVTEIIPTDKFGVLVPPKNAEKLAEGIVKLINDDGLRGGLAISGRKRVEEKYDLGKITSELIKYYEIS